MKGVNGKVPWDEWEEGVKCRGVPLDFKIKFFSIFYTIMLERDAEVHLLPNYDVMQSVKVMDWLSLHDSLPLPHFTGNWKKSFGGVLGDAGQNMTKWRKWYGAVIQSQSFYLTITVPLTNILWQGKHRARKMISDYLKYYS